MFQASAPGSLMLMGEYAVLHGHLALCAAIDKRITVSLSPREDSRITIDSTLGQYESDIHSLCNKKPFEFVVAALKLFALQQGCDIKIESEFSHTMGLSSSAAVTAATLTALYAWQKKPFDKVALLKDAIQVIRTVQGKGSGADVAASIYGGIVCYQFETVLETLLNLPDVTVVFSGEKVKTASAIDIIENRFKNRPEELAALLAELGHLSTKARDAIKKQDWLSLGALFNLAQKKLTTLGVSTDRIHHIIDTLSHDAHALGQKISGAGLGDCVVALGKVLNKNLTILPIQLSLYGAKIEELSGADL